MSRAKWARWIGRTCRQAGAALRLGVALGLVFHLVHTPIHLYLEPHADEADCWATTSLAPSTAIGAEEGHDGGEHHERHPAAQHKFKVTQPTRAPLAKMMPLQMVERAAAQEVCSVPRVFDGCGLSPPELPRCWQFAFRAALPVRAPSLLS